MAETCERCGRDGAECRYEALICDNSEGCLRRAYEREKARADEAVRLLREVDAGLNESGASIPCAEEGPCRMCEAIAAIRAFLAKRAREEPT